MFVCMHRYVYIYIYITFIYIYLWVKISVFSIFKNSLNLFKTNTQILPNIARVRKPYIDWMWNSKEMKDSFSCFSPNGQSLFFFFKCIDSLFRVRILLNKVAETLQTFIKKQTKKTVLQIWYLFYNKKESIRTL